LLQRHSLYLNLFAFICLISLTLSFPFSRALAEAELTGSRLMVYPSYASGEKKAGGLTVGLAKLHGDNAWWSGTGIFAGTVARDPGEYHAEIAYGQSFFNVTAFGGIGVKTVGKEAAFQYSYGLAVGPSALSVRRYSIKNKKFVEGVISLVFPIVI
jgi:hypothetical protein